MEWDGHGGAQEVQHVTVEGGAASAGTFRLAFDGATTAVIPWDASGDQLAKALNALPTTGTVAASALEAAAAGGRQGWAVTFLDNVGDQPALEPAQVMLRGPGAAPALAVAEASAGSSPLFDQGTVGIYSMPLGSTVSGLAPEVQTITVEALAADTFTPLGHFYVSFEGHGSVPISPMASASDMKRALEGVLTIDSVEVSVEDVPMASEAPHPAGLLAPGSHARRWTVTFTGQPFDLPSMLVSTRAGGAGPDLVASAGTLGGSSPVVSVATVAHGGLATEAVVALDGAGAAPSG